MTDQPAARRVQPAHWLLIGAAVLLVALVVAVVVHRGDADPTVSLTPATSTAGPSASAAARPDCVPAIGDTFVDSSKLVVRYGFVYTSRCDQVVRMLRFRVTAQDSSGKALPVREDTVGGGVLFPGTELAAAGTLTVSQDQKVAKLGVTVTGWAAVDPQDFSAWGQARVAELKRSDPDRLGGSTVTGTLQGEPAAAPLCVSQYVLLMRDGGDRIVYADAKPGLTGRRPSFPIPALPNADFARTTIYAAQLPRTEQPPQPGVACDGS